MTRWRGASAFLFKLVYRQKSKLLTFGVGGPFIGWPRSHGELDSGSHNRDSVRPHMGSAILGGYATDLDLLAFLEHIFAPAVPIQTVGRRGFRGPIRHFPV